MNPYQPPSALVIPPLPVAPESSGDFWREGKELVMRQRAQLPPRCVKCNAPAITPIKRRNFYWHHPGLYLLILIGILIYAIVATLTRKSATVAPGLCETHATRRRTIIWAAWIAALIGFVLMFSVDGLGGGALALGILLVLGSLIGGMVGARIMVASGIDDRLARFRGCGKEFLASLPTHPGRREPV
jgi:hypothetical protein